MTAQQVIPGDPRALAALGDQLRSLASGLDEAARTLTQAETQPWQGQAAQAFQAVIHEQPKEYSSASWSFWAAGTAIKAYAGELSAAQGQVGGALITWNTAQSATRSWHSQSMQMTTKTLGGHDPGAAGRASASSTIHAARAQLDAAAGSLRASLAQAASAAPRSPRGLQHLFHDVEGLFKHILGLGPSHNQSHAAGRTPSPPTGTPPVKVPSTPAYEVTRFDQNDSGLVDGKEACGVASLAMVLNFWTRGSRRGGTSPLDVQDDGTLTSHEVWMNWPPSFEIHGEKFSLTQWRSPSADTVGSLLDGALAKGPVIVYLNDAHYVVVTGGSAAAGYTIQDPWYPDRHALADPYALSQITQVVSIVPG